MISCRCGGKCPHEADALRIKMTRDELLVELRRLVDIQTNPSQRRGGDQETDHLDADDALIEYIDDPEIAEAYGNIGKWYA